VWSLPDCRAALVDEEGTSLASMTAPGGAATPAGAVCVG
jgi:hypothetical protein